MLHSSSDSRCSAAVMHWNSVQGTLDFMRMVSAKVSPPPTRDDLPCVTTTLRCAVPRFLVASDSEVATRVEDAARGAAQKIHSRRVLAERHRQFCENPTHARQESVQVGESDRGEGELTYATPSNPHYAAFLRAQM